jgi:hypothetical protein
MSASLEEISRHRLGMVVAGAKFHLCNPTLDYDAIDTIIASSQEYDQGTAEVQRQPQRHSAAAERDDFVLA